jgi:hypothetical protein
MEISPAKEISIREILLSPLNLFNHISTALLPGVLVIFMMMLKHSKFVPAAVAVTGGLGYKTKICLALLIALIIGRAVQSGTFLGFKVIGWLASKAPEPANHMQKHNSEKELDGEPETSTSALVRDGLSQNTAGLLPKNNSDSDAPKPETHSGNCAGPLKSTPAQQKLTPEQESSKHFFSGLLMGTVISADSPLFDSWEAQRAHVGLVLNSGIVLLLSSFWPGDGLRGYEAAVGALLIIMGAIQSRDLNRNRIELMGRGLGQVIASHTLEENLANLQIAARILPTISKHINPTAPEQEPVKIVTELAEKNSPRMNMKPKNQNRPRRR